MIWLVYRQYRSAIIWTTVLTIGLVIGLYALSVDARDIAPILRIHGCTAFNSSPFCSSLTGRFIAHSNWSTGTLIDVLYIAPGLLGVIFGVSLVAREFESGTIGLVWLQTLTRRHWLWTKSAVCGAIVLVVAVTMDIVANLWGNSVYARLVSPYPLTSRIFDSSGVVIIGYCLLALGIGILVGTVLRRSGIGVAVGLVVFAILRLGLEKGVRPLIETRRFVAEAVLPPFTPQSGILIQEGFLPLHQLVPKSGQGFSISSVCQSSVQAPSGGADPRFTNCLRQHGLHFVVEYIPNSSYWSAQVLELSVCVVMFVLAVVASRWMLSRVDV